MSIVIQKQNNSIINSTDAFVHLTHIHIQVEGIMVAWALIWDLV